MLVLQALKWLVLAAEVLIAVPILYLCILSISAISTARKRKARDSGYLASESSICADFAILIPAHNEEIILGNLLNSLAALAYPKDRFTVYVVADNCTDRTAELARATDGIRVYERSDETRRGKGYALSWLLQQLEESQLIHDAYVVLDADSVVEPTFLQAINRSLARGPKALQACNTVLNISESPSTALRLVALTLVNHVRPLGRNGLGSSSTLTGNGMCLSRTILMRYPWRAFAIAEDYQYYLTLVQHGERVEYVPEAIVRSHMPATLSRMRTQDVRWESAAPGQSAWRVALKLFGAGLHLHNFICLEAVAELLTPPLSLLVCWCLLTLLVSSLLWAPLELLFGLLLIAGLACYIGTGLYLLRPPRKVYIAFLYAPVFMAWKLWVYLILKRSKKHTGQWIRTSRAGL